jgi:hypothetical protein
LRNSNSSNVKEKQLVEDIRAFWRGRVERRNEAEVSSGADGSKKVDAILIVCKSNASVCLSVCAGDPVIPPMHSRII